MQAIVPGHSYECRHFADREASQVLRFIHKEPVEPGSQELRLVSDGTTNEEVLAVLIDRLQYLQAKSPCRENAIVITKLEESLMWLEKRTADRKTRGVEGRNV